MTAKTKFIAGSIILLTTFLAGFIPQYLEKGRLQSELRTSGEQVRSLEAALRMAELRDLCGIMLLEVLQQNYGLAREHSTEYFERVRQATDDAQNPLGPPLRDLLGRRDSITAFLAQSDPASSPEIQTLCRRTNEITRR
jgi:hypothetical protein